MNFKLGAFLIISAQICTSLTLKPCACARNYSPVCGSDGKTYSNQCVLDCAAYTSGKDITTSRTGPCEEPEESDCFCPDVEQPVCGTDGNTYPNDCILECQRTFDPSLRVMDFSGPCKASKEPALTVS